MIRMKLCSQSVPSIRILMKRICIGLRGLLSPKHVLSVIKVNAAAAVLSWNDKKFWMLWKMDFPVRSLAGSWTSYREYGTFFNGRQNGAEVVVHQDHIGRLLGYIRTALAH